MGLDWRRNTVGDPLPCRHCGKPAMCRDDQKRPAHKVCAEAHQAASNTQTAAEYFAAGTTTTKEIM